MTNQELFETYRSDVYRTCYYMLGQEADAEDVCQEVFLTAFRTDWTGIEHVKAWLLRIAVNQCVNLLKRRSNLRTKLSFYSHLLVGKAEQTPEIRAEQHEAAEEWAACLARLPVKIRTVVSLRFVHDLGISEIAELLGIPPGTVKSRQHKGLKLLRGIVDDHPSPLNLIQGGTYEYQTYKG